MRSMALALGLLVSVAVAAHAQAIAPWQPEPPAAGWTLTPTLGVGLFHDSNLRLQARRPATGEWVALVQPRGELDFIGRRTRFTAGYAGSLETFRDVDYLNRYQQRAQIGASRLLLPRLTVRADAGYQVSPTTDEIQDGTVPFAAVGSRALTANAGVDGVLSRRARLSGTYRFQRLDYEEAPLEQAILRGGYAHMPAVRVSYDLSRRAVVDAHWNYTHGEVAGDVGAFRLQYIGGGWRYRLHEQLTIGASGGATAFTAAEVDVSGWGPAAQAFVEQQAGRNTLSVQYSYAIVPAFGQGGLSRQQRIGAGAHVPLMAGRTYVSGTLALSRDEAVEGLGRGLDTRTVWLQGAVGYHLSRWLRAETFVNTARQRSLAPDGHAVQRMRLGVQFVTAKPMRIH